MDGGIYISSTWAKECGLHVKLAMAISFSTYERLRPYTEAQCLSFYFVRKWELLGSFPPFLVSGWTLSFTGIHDFQKEKKIPSLLLVLWFSQRVLNWALQVPSFYTVVCLPGVSYLLEFSPLIKISSVTCQCCSEPPTLLLIGPLSSLLPSVPVFPLPLFLFSSVASPPFFHFSIPITCRC